MENRAGNIIQRREGSRIRDWNLYDQSGGYGEISIRGNKAGLSHDRHSQCIHE